LRLADAEILPFDFGFYAESIRDFVHEVKKKKGAARYVDLNPLWLQVAELQRAGFQLRQAMDDALARGVVDGTAAERINRRLMAVEGNWLNPDGIPGRPWFKHVLYAARFTYAHLELPGLTEAVEKGDWRVAGEQARILENAVARNAGLLREAADALRKLDRGSSSPTREQR
jgi:N-acetylated-alpha-linked acidic dipeptidase